MKQAVPVRSSDVGTIWDQVEHLLVDALEKSGRYHGLEDVRRRCLEKEATLWIGTDDGKIESVAVTEIHTGIEFKVPRIWLWAGADGGAWIASHLASLETWARHEGGSFIETECRPGLQRKLPGWKVVRVVLRKDLR